jgi:hypothetical protein
MASLPPQRPASQHRPSPPAESSSSQNEQGERTNSFSGQSVDSQTLLLNSPPAQATTPAQEEHKEPPAPEKQKESHTRHSAPQEEDDDPRKCWICFNDETEDDETTSEWRSPCACSLVAHEKCLLDWIADMEAPSSGRRAGRSAGKILCPQCKSEIVVERSRSYVVDAVRTAERLAGSLLLPGFALVTGTALYTTLTLSGTATIYQIFGTQDALRILSPLYETPSPAVNSVVMRWLLHLRQHWRLDLGLPLIPTVLVASRTTFADSFLPFLPLIFFVSSGQPGDEMLQLQWPPSAAFSFAALPYLRGFYNAYYDRVWLPREQQWLKEIQPRAGEDANADAQVQGEDEDADEDIEEVEIQLDLGMFGGWNNGGNEEDDNDAFEAPPVPAAREPAGPIDAPPQDDEDDDDDIPELIDIGPANPQAQQNAAPAPRPVRQRHEPRAAPPPDIPLRNVRRERRERAVTFSTTSLADTILGALIFPTLAAAVGELLRHTLPTSWVTPPTGSPVTCWLGGWINTGGKIGGVGKPTGFLQTRWGRSIVGGCLFVGMKDLVMLYVRWKTAQNHRKRHIKDHDRKKGRAGTAPT